MARGSAAPGRDQVAVRVSGEWEIEAWEETEVYRRVVRDGGRWGRLPLVALRKQIDAGACGPFALFDRIFIFLFLLDFFCHIFTVCLLEDEREVSCDLLVANKDCER